MSVDMQKIPRGIDLVSEIIAHQNVFMTTEKRWYTAENAYTTEGQICAIARYTTLIVRGTMFDSKIRVKNHKNRP